MGLKAARAEQIRDEKNRWVDALSRAWVGLFLFTVFINVLPFLPSWNSSVEEIAQVVVEANHLSVCSSQKWDQTPKSDTRSFFTTASSTLLLGSQRSDVQCTCTVVSHITPQNIDPLFWFFADQGLSINPFFTSNRERGPPRV